MDPALRCALVVPAAGSGQRLGQSLPKALVEVGGRTLLRCTLERLAASLTFVETVVLAPPDRLPAFERALDAAPAALGRVRVHAGGATRQQSVAAGVAALADDVDLVCVHDAARPLVTPSTVRRTVEAAAATGVATAASRPADSVRIDTADGRGAALDRATLWLVETPQAFRRSILREAHAEATRLGAQYTDDASLVEACGHRVAVVDSGGGNRKVTVAADLLHVRASLGDRS